MATIFTLAFAGDHGRSGTTPGGNFGTGVGKSVSVANPDFFIIGGDTYGTPSLLNATNVAQYSTMDFFSGSNLKKSATIHIPGNHDNGIGTGTTEPDITAWQSFWAGTPGTGTLAGYTLGTSPNFNTFFAAITGATGATAFNRILNTDMFIDFPSQAVVAAQAALPTPKIITPWRFFFFNDGAIVNGSGVTNATPGWPVPFGHSDLYPTEAQINLSGGPTYWPAKRVKWLRDNLAPGNHNVFVFHHPRFSPAQGHTDNAAMNYLAQEAIGANDGSNVQRAELLISGHTHQHQINKRRNPTTGAIVTSGLGVVQVGCGSGALLDSGINPGETNNAQFIGVNQGYALLQIGDDNTLKVSMIDADNSTAGVAAVANASYTGNSSVVNFTQTTVATPIPTATVSAAVTFPTTAAGATSGSVDVTITNTGAVSSTLTIPANGIALGGAGASRFTITAGAATTAINLAKGASQTVTLTFSPTATDTGNILANLTFTDNDSNTTGSTQSIALTGPVTPAASKGVLSNTSLAFSVAAGNTSPTQRITLSNTGGQTLHVTTIAITGAQASMFATSNDGLTGANIIAGSSAFVDIAFSPPAGSTATMAALLTINDDSGGNTTTQTVTLSGTETASVGIGTLNLSSAAFGSVAVGNATGVTQTFTLTNVGNNPSTLAVTSATITGTNAAQFSITSDSGQTNLPFNQTRTVIVKFFGTGATVGNKTATLRFTDNTGGVAGSFQDVALSGTIIAAGTPLASVTPGSPVDFGTSSVGQSDSRTITVTNTGTSALTIASVAVADTSAPPGGGNPPVIGATKVVNSAPTTPDQIQNSGVLAGVAAGDLILAEVRARGVTAAQQPVAPDGHWVTVQTNFLPATSPAGAPETTLQSLFHGVYYKIATDTTGVAAGTGLWVFTGAKSCSIQFTRITGADPNTPVRTSSKNSDGGQNITTTTPAFSGIVAKDTLYTSAASSAGPQPWPNRGDGCLFGMMPAPAGGGSFAKYAAQSDTARLETLLGRKFSHSHSWAYGVSANSWDFSEGFPTAVTSGPRADYANGRMTFLSWFPDTHPWPYSDAQSPLSGLQAIANGTHDGMLFGNGQTLLKYGEPLIYRWGAELNGGDHPWEAGYTKSTQSYTVQQWNTAWLAAWKRIWIITKGTQADATAAGFGPSDAHPITQFANAQNVYFHWNCQTAESTSMSRDLMYPGDKYVDLAGSEMYLPASTANADAKTDILEETSKGGTHKAVVRYSDQTGFAADANSTGTAGNKVGANGEGGPRGGTAASWANRIPTFLPALKAYPGWGIFSYWDGGSGSSTSDIEQMAAAAQTLVKNWVQDPYMNPTLTTTYIPLLATNTWKHVFQSRWATGQGAGANTGTNQVGGTAITKVASAITEPGQVLNTYGYGKTSNIAVAFIGAGGTVTGVAPAITSVNIDDNQPNYNVTNPDVLKNTVVATGNPTPTITYQWQRSS